MGTAGEYDLYVLVELALPWTPDPWKSPRLPEGLNALAARAQVGGVKARYLAIQPDPEYSEPNHTRIFIFRRPAPMFAHYDKTEYLVPSGDLVDFLGALLDKEPGSSSYEQPNGSVREMLVCTHGTRDACCGKFGYSVYSLLRHVFAPDLDGAMRAWRVSHLGGHRFAPNLLDFPDGRYWGRLDEGAARTLLFQDQPPSLLRSNYRGWSGLDPLAQVAEKEILMREGWAWTAYRKVSQTLDRDVAGTRAEIRIEYAAPDGAWGAYRATVEKSGVVQMNTCLSVEPLRDVSQYTVTSLESEL